MLVSCSNSPSGTEIPQGGETAPPSEDSSTIAIEVSPLAGPYSDLHAAIESKLSYLHQTLSDADTQFTSEIVDMDLDDDGDLDVILFSSTVFVDPEGSHHEMIIYRNLQGAGFSEEPQSIRAYARDTAVEDFNGDGRTDIFLADHGLDIPPFPGGQDQVLFQTDSGVLEQAAEGSWPHQGLFSHSTCAGDVDSDGDMDIHVALGSGQMLYINDGSGGFAYEGDARLPLQKITWFTYQAISGIFMQSLSELSFYWCEMADINMDGAIDLLLGDHSTPSSTDSDGNVIGNSHLLLLNDGMGTFLYNHPDSLIPNAVYEGYRPGSLPNATVEMKSFDANRDQCPDLVTVSTNYEGKQVVTFFLNDCSGNLTLSDAHQLAGIDWTDIVFVLDLNDDQLDDVVTAYITEVNHVHPIGVTGGRAYLNNGDGTFEEAPLLPDYLYLGGPKFYLALRAAGVVP
jgi:hypothetical protein